MLLPIIEVDDEVGRTFLRFCQEQDTSLDDAVQAMMEGSIFVWETMARRSRRGE